MPKRLTDTAKWDKIWFRKLEPVYKCLWVYICDRCDHAGIWEVDFETASYYIGQSLDQNQVKQVFNKQYIGLNEGSRWLLKDFIFFQYGRFDETNKMFKPIQSSLNRYGVSMGDIWGIDPRKVKVKVKRKVKVKEKASNKESLPESIVLWNEFCLINTSLSKIEALSGSRADKLNKRLAEPKFNMAEIIKAIGEQRFLIEGNPSSKEHAGWKVSFDWLIFNDTNYLKVLERRYKNDRMDLPEIFRPRDNKK